MLEPDKVNTRGTATWFTPNGVQVTANDGGAALAVAGHVLMICEENELEHIISMLQAAKEWLNK